MSEPRTIKELRGFWMPNQVKARKFRMIEESELRAEAIKWIKKYAKERESEERGSEGAFIDGQIDSMIDFHNITNEELI